MEAHRKPGQAFEVCELLKSEPQQAIISHRLMEMGLLQGCKIAVLQQVAFGGPILIQFGSTVLALREEEFQCLQLKKV